MRMEAVAVRADPDPHAPAPTDRPGTGAPPDGRRAAGRVPRAGAPHYVVREVR